MTFSAERFDDYLPVKFCAGAGFKPLFTGKTGMEACLLGLRIARIL
jgi:hypothetical protein